MQENAALARIDRARQWLTEAKSLEEIKAVRDMAEAARLYARAAGLGEAAMNEAAEIKLRAERKAGEALAGMEKNKGGRPAKTDELSSSVSEPTLDEIGITPKQSEFWQAEATVPEPEFEGWVISQKEEGRPITTKGLVKRAKQQQARTEAAQGEALLARLGESDGKRRAAFRKRFSKAIADTYGSLLAFDAELVADHLLADELPTVRGLIRALRQWCDSMETAVSRGLHVIGERKHG